MNGSSYRLGLPAATAIVVGTVLSPALFQFVSRPPGIMWIATGLVVLCGALAFSELARQMPESGGPYVFLRAAFGPVVAAMFGWSFFLVVAGPTIAWLASAVAAELPLGRGLSRAAAALLIGVLTWVNHRSRMWSAKVQIVCAAVQAAALGLAMAYGSRAPQPPARALDLMLCLPAFAGWPALSFVAAEIRDPKRNIPLAFLIGLGICTLLFALPFAPDRRVSIVLAVGAANGWLMTAPWISFAQAGDHAFFRRFGEIHGRCGTPSVATLMLGVWAATLAIAGMYAGALAYGGLIAWSFYGLTALGLLRRRRYVLAIPFLLAAFAFAIHGTLGAPVAALNAILMTASGAGALFIWRRFIR